jgi:hypothetical protein
LLKFPLFRVPLIAGRNSFLSPSNKKSELPPLLIDSPLIALYGQSSNKKKITSQRIVSARNFILEEARSSDKFKDGQIGIRI